MEEDLFLKREVLEKLRRRNEEEVLPFVEIFASHRKARKRCEKLQHEVQQLRNKTAELSGKKCWTDECFNESARRKRESENEQRKIPRKSRDCKKN